MKTSIPSQRDTLAATRADLQAMYIEIANLCADWRAHLDLFERRLTTRVGGGMIVVATVLFAALHYWPPHQ
jgi:hypothetical protein